MLTTIHQLARHAFDFSGRASPREFWVFCALAVLCLTPALLTEFRFLYWESYPFERWITRTNTLTGVTTLHVQTGVNHTLRLVGVDATAVTFVPLAALTLPFLAICSRRMHDLGRPGWWALVAVYCAFLLGPSIAYLGVSAAHISSTLATILLFLADIPSLIVSILALLLLVMWTASAGEETENEYGPPPHEVAT